MSEHLQALQEATGRLYDVFDVYQEQELDTEFEHLTTDNLNTLSVSDLTPVIQHLTAQDGSILLRFLPRILELCIDGYYRWSISLDAVFSTLNTCNWREWSEIEQRSIENFMRSLWLYHLSNVSPTGTHSSADTLLEAISQVMDVQPFLDVWMDISGASATAHIASLTVYGKKRLRDVRHWLSQPNILQRIEAAFWDSDNIYHAAMFAKAVDYLRLIHSPMPA